MWEEKHLYSDHRVNKTTKKTVKADHCANGPLNQIFMSNGKHQGFHFREDLVLSIVKRE